MVWYTKFSCIIYVKTIPKARLKLNCCVNLYGNHQLQPTFLNIWYQHANVKMWELIRESTSCYLFTHRMKPRMSASSYITPCSTSPCTTYAIYTFNEEIVNCINYLLIFPMAMCFYGSLWFLWASFCAIHCGEFPPVKTSFAIHWISKTSVWDGWAV